MLLNILQADGGLLIEASEIKFSHNIEVKKVPALECGGKIQNMFMELYRPTEDKKLDGGDFSDSMPRLQAAKKSTFRKVLDDMSVARSGSVSQQEFYMHFLRQGLESKPKDPKLFQNSNNMLDLLNICSASINDKVKLLYNKKIEDYDLRGVSDLN